MSKFEKNLFDVRTKNAFKKLGALTEDQWQKNLKNLPDDSGNTDELLVYEEPTILTDTLETHLDAVTEESAPSEDWGNSDPSLS
jgi:hypothetical protein